MIANLDEIFNHTLNMNWLYDFISIWKHPLMFHSNEHKFEKNNIFEKNYSFQKVMRIALKILCFKYILCVCQNTRWNKTKFSTKIMQNVFFKLIYSLAQLAPHSVKSPFDTHLYLLSGMRGKKPYWFPSL